MSPIYEYECDHCGHEFQKLAPMSERHHQTCPSCESPNTELLLSSGPAHGLSTPGPGNYTKDTDPGFQKEWDSIWEDDNA